jgi:hypothetical protein
MSPLLPLHSPLLTPPCVLYLSLRCHRPELRRRRVGPHSGATLRRAVDLSTRPLLFPIESSSSCAVSATPSPVASGPGLVPPLRLRALPHRPSALLPDNRRHPQLLQPSADELLCSDCTTVGRVLS